MDHLLLQRQLGSHKRHADAYTNALVRRLANTQVAPTDAASGATAWDDSGILLACAAEDSTLRLWNCDKGGFTHKLEPGHTDPITCADFLPATGGRLLVSAGPSKDIRVTDLERQAVRPYASHVSSIKSLLPINCAVFASGGEDGSVHCFDTRETESIRSQGNNRSLLIDQKSEAHSLSGGRVSILSMSQDPLRQQYIATGGNDALVRVYDVRMMRNSSTAASWRSSSLDSQPTWCYCLAPNKYRQRGTYGRSYQISSVAFDPSGQRLLAGYTGKETYSFDVRQHACSYNDLTGDRQPQHQRHRSWWQRGQSTATSHGSGERRGRERGNSLAGSRPASSRLPTRAAQAAAGRASDPAIDSSHRQQEAMAAYTAARQHAEVNRQRRQQQLQSGQESAGEGEARVARMAPGGRSGTGRRNLTARRRHRRQPADEDSAPGGMQAAAAAEAEIEQPAPAESPMQRQQQGSQQQHAVSTPIVMDGHQAQRQPSLSAAHSPGGAEAAQHSTLHVDRQLGSADTTPGDTGSEGESDASEMSGAGSEILLAAEIHFVGADGTLLHTARMPLSRAPRAAADAFLRAGRRRSAGAIAAGETADPSTSHTQQQEGLHPQPQQQAGSPPLSGPVDAPVMLPSQAVMLGLQHHMQEAERAVQQRQEAEMMLQRVQQRAAELQAEQARLMQLRDALQQHRSLLDEAPQADPASAAAPSSAHGQAASQQEAAARVTASSSPPASAAAVAPLQLVGAPQQLDFMAQLQATAAGFAVPQQQQQQRVTISPIAVATAALAGEGNAGGDGNNGRGAIGRISTGGGRRSLRPRRSCRTVVQEPFEPPAADTLPLMAAAAAAAGHAAVERQPAERAPRQSNRRRSSSIAAAAEGAASGPVAGSRSRRRAAGAHMAFMGLDGEGAGSCRNIADISPSVVGQGDTAAAFINGRHEARAATSGRQASRLQQHPLHPTGVDGSVEDDEPTAKRTRAQQDSAAVGGIAAHAQQPTLEQDPILPFGRLLPQETPEEGLSHLHGDSAAPPPAAAAPTNTTPDLPAMVGNAVGMTPAAAGAEGTQQLALQLQQLAHQITHSLPGLARPAADFMPVQSIAAAAAAAAASEVPGRGSAVNTVHPVQHLPELAAPEGRMTRSHEHADGNAMSHTDRPQSRQRSEQPPVPRPQSPSLPLLPSRRHQHPDEQPAMLEQQQRQRRRHQQQQANPAHGPGGPMDMLFGAILGNMGQAFASGNDDGEFEIHIPVDHLIGNGSGPQAATAADGHAPTRPDRAAAAAVGRAEVNNAAAMLRAELGLPSLSRAQAEQQLQDMPQASNLCVQPAAGQDGTSSAWGPRAGAVQLQQTRQPSEAVDKFTEPQQPTDHKPQPRQQQQQQTSHLQDERHLQRTRCSKRKRSDNGERQQQFSPTHAPPAAAAAIPFTGEGRPPSGSDAAFVAALDGHRSSRNLQSNRPPAGAAHAAGAATAAEPAHTAAAFAPHDTAGPGRGRRGGQGRTSRVVLDEDDQVISSSPPAPAAAHQAVMTRGQQQQQQQQVKQSAQCAVGPAVIAAPGGDKCDNSSASVPLDSSKTSLAGPGSRCLNNDGVDDEIHGFTSSDDDGSAVFETAAPLYSSALTAQDFWDHSEHSFGNPPTAATEEDDVLSQGYSCCFQGHRNMVSSRNAAWLGRHGEYVVSGSDDGRLFVWDAGSAAVVAVAKGGGRSIKRVAVNPKHLLLASCGPEPVVRFWSPTADMPTDAAEAAAAVATNQEEGEEDALGRHMFAGGLVNLLNHMSERIFGGLLGMHEGGIMGAAAAAAARGHTAVGGGGGGGRRARRVRAGAPGGLTEPRADSLDPARLATAGGEAAAAAANAADGRQAVGHTAAAAAVGGRPYRTRSASALAAAADAGAGVSAVGAVAQQDPVNEARPGPAHEQQSVAARTRQARQ